MLKSLRLFKIIRIVLQYGIDEIAMSGLRVPRTARLIKRLLFWRDLSAPRGERLRKALEDLGPIFVKFVRDVILFPPILQMSSPNYKIVYLHLIQI
jgi:ubiquinone biosynthesis protein